MRHRPNPPSIPPAALLALLVVLALPSSLVAGVPQSGAQVGAGGPHPPGVAHEPIDGGAVGSVGGEIDGWAFPDGSIPALTAMAPAPERSPSGVAERDAGRVDSGEHDGPTRRVTLVTGETVAVHGEAGERSYEVISGGPVHVVTANERTYLLPEGVDLGTYDRSLFSVEALLSARADGGLPVLLDADATAAVDAAGLRNVRHLRSAGVVAAELDPARADGVVARLVEDGLVQGVSLDRTVERPLAAVPAAPAPGQEHDVTGEGVTVAVLDTGVDATHPDLADRVVDQVDLVEGDPNGDEDRDVNESRRGHDEVDAIDVAPDANGHGTHVAGVVAGTGGDGGAHAGVAPGADVVDVRVMNDRGAGRASTIVEGIEYAVERDVDVILLSVGTSIDGGGAIADGVEWATEQGVVVVAAAGNEGNPRTIGAPGRPAGAITVGATTGGEVAAYSSRGPTLDGGLKPDLVAPGGGIVGPRSSTSGRPAIDDDGRYTRMSGTSAAAPRVAGAAALLLEAEPGLSAEEIEARLGSTARPVRGGGAYAQGSGEIDVRRALDPDVVVGDPAIDLGLLSDGGTVNRTIAVTNHDDRRHDLTFDVRVRNVDLGEDANGTASLSRNELSLAPGERANLTLSIDGDTASGAHAGEIRYAVAGEPRTVAFGFVRGGTVTVEKRPLSPDSRTDGDPLWVLAGEGTHDELLQFENGTASFVAGGGPYLLWSWGTDEGTGRMVFISERRGFDGTTRVVLDERETVPVGVDAGAIAERFGPLTNRSVTVSLLAAYGDGESKLSVSNQDTESRTVQVSPDPELSVATAYLLTTEPRGSAPLDVSDVFQLSHGVDGVRGPSVVEADLDRLATAEQRLHRTTVDETYRVQDRVVMDGVWNQINRRWFDLGGRGVQRIHRFPAAATYHRAFRGEGWSAQREFHGGTAVTADVLAHPMHGLVETLRVEDGTATVAGVPFSDGSGTRFDPPGDHRMTVSVNGAVVHDEQVRGGRGGVDDVAVGPGDRLTVRLAGDNPGGHLSTRTLTEVTIPAYAPGAGRRAIATNRPPVVTNVSVRGAGPANAVEPGEVTAVYDVDAVGPIDAPAVWYAVRDPGAPPWEDATDWRRAETERRDDRLLARFDVDESAETVSLAAELGDFRGHRTRTMTVDAVHVGAAPDTTTSVLSGRLLAADGTPAANDTVVVESVDDDVGPADEVPTRFLTTDEDGRFAVELPKGQDYDLTYVRGEPWVANAPTPDDRPAWLPLDRVPLEEDVDLGVRSLPAARELTIDVIDERSEPVSGATVRLTGRVGNLTATEVMETGEDGLARRSGREEAGIELAGTVELVVEPPADELYPGGERRYSVALDEARSVNVTVETAPPTADLAAFGTFEPGEVVFLTARGSEAPAGVAEYRWDLDDDGAAERVTEDPVVRYAPDETTWRPTVTVVDEAGKTADATLTIAFETD